MRYPIWRLGIFVAALVVPLYWFYQAWLLALGPDPGKVLVDRFGLGTLVMLLVTLSMTPLQKLTGWPAWLLFRRQLGLWCFAYVVMHLLSYLVFILGLDWSQLGIELRKRPYVIVGAVAFILLMALAVTSNRYSQRKLGRRWKKLHYLIYAVLCLGLLHFLWIVRADLKEWTVYAGIGAVLLVLRLPAISKRLSLLRARSGNKTSLSS